MDYQEEQSSEMEALESIYEGDLEVLASPEAGDSHFAFTMPVKTEDYDPDDEDKGIFVLLKFTLTPKYPEELPDLEAGDESDQEEGDRSDVDDDIPRLDVRPNDLRQILSSNK